MSDPDRLLPAIWIKGVIVIYAFADPKHVQLAVIEEEKIPVKCGETHLEMGQTVEQAAKLRIANQHKSSNAFKPIILGYWEVDKSKIPGDRTLHDVWEKEGLRDETKLDGAGTEFYTLGYSIKECKTKIENTIESFNQSTGKSFTLRKEQQRTLDEAIKIYNSTNKDRVNIVANLAPRFGKTLWVLRLFNELNKKILVLPSAVLSTHTSFKEDINNFQGLEDVVYITTHENPHYAQQIEIALSKNKRVAVTVSLFTQNKKELKYIRDMSNNDKFLCLDEGDFGAWTPPKREILEYLMPDNDTGKYCFMSMSGTNIARMVTGSKCIDGVITSTYMALELTEKNIIRRRFVNLKLSNNDKYVKKLTKDDYFSWNKVTGNPFKSENFLKEFSKGITGNTTNDNYKGLSLSNMMEENFTCGMMFFSGTNNNINKIAKIIARAIPEWEIVVLNSEHTSNKKSEGVVKTQISIAKNMYKKEGVLILSNTMGSRSFSIPEVQATIICYDNGGAEQTIQKSSRCLTPGKKMNGESKEYGYIVSCSMDSNRTTTDIILDSNLVSEAAIQSSISGIDFNKTLKQVLNCVSILSTDEYGNRVDLVEDDEAIKKLMKELSSTKELTKVAYALCNPDKILDDQDMLNSFLAMDFGKGKKDKKNETELLKANNYKTSGKSNKKISEKKKNDDLDIIRKNIKKLVYSASMLSSKTEGRTYRECLKNIDDDVFKRIWTIDKNVVISALDTDALPEKWLDVIVCTTDDIIKSGNIQEWHNLPTFGSIPELGISESDETQVWFDILEPLNLKGKKIASLATKQGKEISALLNLGVKPEDITVIDEDGFFRVWKETGINVVENFSEIQGMKKFDIVIANPPYKGKARLHQQFFNTACEELTKDGGYTIFLQPATTYLNQKEVKTKHEKMMIGNILKYKTNVKILPRDIFKNAVSENELAITFLNKIENTTGKLNSLIYKDGKKYENVGLEDINIHSLDNKIFRKIKEKYEKYILQNGSLNDSTYYSLNNPINNICGLPKLRSNIGTAHFFTFLPNPIEKTKYYTTKISEKHDFGIRVKNNKQIKNVYSYLQTFCARFGLALLKINANNHMGEFRKVPLVDFDKKWTDKLLIEELKLTQEEFKIIADTLGHYHG